MTSRVRGRRVLCRLLDMLIEEYLHQEIWERTMRIATYWVTMAGVAGPKIHVAKGWSGGAGAGMRTRSGGSVRLYCK